MDINIPEIDSLKPKISVFGVGGAGGNALNNMIKSKLEGVFFVAANTDAQTLSSSPADAKIQLGVNLTKGLGAGSEPESGKNAAEENIEDVTKYLKNNNMIFITAGMGGGTGTGAAPVIAKVAKELGILTVGVVTKPFDFEGKYRMETAKDGIEELKKYVDTLIIIPNQNLFRIANEKTTFESAFKMADDVLHAGVRGITDLITMPGLVNLDFADIKTIMTKMGKAMMGTGEAEGENRAEEACKDAISNPLLDDISINGAKGVLVNITGGTDMTLFEVNTAINIIRNQVDENANIIFGSAFNESMKNKIRISVVATGIEDPANNKKEKIISIQKDHKEQNNDLLNLKAIHQKESEIDSNLMKNNKINNDILDDSISKVNLDNIPIEENLEQNLEQNIPLSEDNSNQKENIDDLFKKDIDKKTNIEKKSNHFSLFKFMNFSNNSKKKQKEDTIKEVDDNIDEELN